MINISSRLSEAALFFKATKVGVCVWMRRLRALVPGCIHALHYLCLSFVYAYSTATMTVSHMARDVLKSCVESPTIVQSGVSLQDLLQCFLWPHSFTILTKVP